MNNFESKLLGVSIIVIFSFLILSASYLFQIDNLEKANEQLKKEKYELKQKLEKAENDKLKCLVGIGE